VQALISCVSREVVLTDGQNIWLSRNPALLATSAQPPHRLTGPVEFTIQQELVGTPDPNQLHLERYNYRVVQADQEVAAYHRHGGRHDYDHLHTSLGALRRLALPTGRFLNLASIIRFCITELHVEPLRRDWQVVMVRLE
jgi:hypothetical protein